MGKCLSSTLSVYASEGDDDLQLVAGPVSNDPKVVAAENVQKGEWHVQLIKLYVALLSFFCHLQKY